MHSHEIDYQIQGGDLQCLEVGLDAGETVVAEPGTMMYMEEGIVFKTKKGDGSQPDRKFLGRLSSGLGRAASRDGRPMTQFTNDGHGRAHVAFAAPYPGRILPLELAALGGAVICERRAFVCAARGTRIKTVFYKMFTSGLLGGEGFVLQEVSGDGLAFLHTGGTVVEKHLHGETLRVDTGCLVAFDPAIDYSVTRAGQLKSTLLITLNGTGRVWLQSLPFARLASRVAATAWRQTSVT